MFTLKRLLVIIIVLLGTLIARNGDTAESTGQWWTNVEGRATVAKEEFLVGEPISMKVVVTNRHNGPVYLWDIIERTFQFSAQDSFGRLVKKRKGPGLSGLFPVVPLRPGTDFNDVVFMNEYLDFPGPGIYRVTYRGYIYLDKGSPKSQHGDVRTVALSGVVNVKLCTGSINQLESALQEYFKQLRSADDKLQRQAARALSVSEPVLALKLLRKALESENGSYPIGATKAAWALGKIGTEQAIQALLDLALHANHWMVRTNAIGELGRWHIKKAVPPLTNLLSDENPRIRIAALRSLGYIGDKSCISEVELRFNDTDEKVRAAAREAYNILTKKKEIRKE